MGGLEAGDGWSQAVPEGWHKQGEGWLLGSGTHREPQQHHRYTSCQPLIVFHIVIVLKCQRQRGFSAGP